MKKMTRYLGVALLCLYSTINVWAQPNITQAEYFVDADPGIGIAFPLTIAPGTNLQNQIFNIDPTLYTPGVHRIGVRAKDANGAWSLTNYLAFARAFAPLPQEPAIANITNIEYFIDTDPGIGIATPLPLTPSTNISNITFNIDPTLYSSGVHRLGMRAKSGGSWSLTNYMLFAKAFPALPQEPAVTNITNVEYFIDADPGIGKAVQLAFVPGADLANYTANVNITGLAAGPHKIVFRGKNAAGAWSLSNMYSFTVTTSIAAPAIEINSISKTLFCAKDSFAIGYQKTGNYTDGNIFTAYLSDAAGSFASETAIGSRTDTGSGLIICNLPPHVVEGSGYKLRVKSNNAVVTGNTSTATLTIHDRPFPQTITGLTQVNGTFTQSYTIPTATGSNWNWQPTGGIQSSGSTTNTVNIAWTQPASPSINGKINVIETSQYGCVGDTSTLNLTIYKLRIGNTIATSACKGFGLNVSLNADGAYYTGNTYTAQLSDATGNFTAPISIGSAALAGNSVGQTAAINATVPAGIPNGTGYKIRIVSSNPAFTGDTSAAISIIKPDIGTDKTVTISCPGSTYDLTTLFTTTGLTTTWSIATPNVAPAGICQLIVTNTNGCRDTANVTINNAPLTTVPTVANTKMANRECTTADGWTHYYFDNNTPADYSDDIRLLSLKKNGQNIGTIGDGTFQVKVAATTGAGTNTAVQVSSPLITNPFWSMNRYWTVTPTQQPISGNVGVRFYYNTQDLTDVNGSYPNGPVMHTQLVLYKTDGNPDPNSNFAGATQLKSYLHGATPSATNWAYTSLGNSVHQAEFEVTSLSGGGAGATQNGGTLPVSLLRFTVAGKNSKALLNWSTATESNSRNFLIERSLDGVHYTTIGSVNAAGQSTVQRNYSFTDDVSSVVYQSTNVYYRLQLVDVNNDRKTSSVVSVKLGESKAGLSLLYNPVQSQAVVQYQSIAAQKITLRVIDASGKIILVKNEAAIAGTNQYRIATAALAEAIYTVQLINASGETLMVRMIKE